MGFYNSKIQEEEDINILEASENLKSLILHNDEVHTFDYVIDSLIEICDHDLVQAEQCTYIIHYKGKCDVKKGSFNDLKKMKDGLIQKELSATIE